MSQFTGKEETFKAVRERVAQLLGSPAPEVVVSADPADPSRMLVYFPVSPSMAITLVQDLLETYLKHRESEPALTAEELQAEANKVCPQVYVRLDPKDPSVVLLSTLPNLKGDSFAVNVHLP